MKKHYSIRYKACGLVFAIAVTNALAVTGSPLNLGSSKLFPESTLTIAKADDVLSENIILSADDLRISSNGNVIEGLSDTGKSRLMSAIKENAVYQLVFPESLSATEIKDEAFHYIYESLATSSNADDFDKYKIAQKMKITVKLSDNITKVGDGAFRQNPYITGVIFGDKTEYIGEASFQYCKIKGGLILPDTVSYIGSGAFNDNRITEVKLPDNIKKVEHRAFSDNRITHFDFGAYTSVNTEANIGRIVNPDTDELEYIKVSGKVIPDYFLTNNPLSEIVLPSGITAIGIEAFRLAQDSDYRPENPVNNLIIPETVEDIGVAAFMGHPINSLTLTESSLKRIRERAFEDSHIGGDLTIPDSVNIIENKAFKNNNLKSIMVGGLKAEIKSANSTDNSPFSDNPGWYDDNRKVALYRGNEANEFITDNKLADTTTYVYNPVVLEFNIKDKNGVDLKPATVRVVRDNATVPDVNDVKDTEYDTYKLGDKLTFTLSGSLPDGYEFSASGIKSLGNNVYELTLDPANTELIKTITYEDMYKAGYKKTTISLVPKAIEENSPSPSEPATPSIPSISEESKKDESKKDEPKKNEPKKNEPKKNEPKKDEPKTTDNTNTSGNNTTPGTTNTPSNNTITPNQPNNTVITTVPTINPPTNIPFVPERIVNPNIIPEGNPVFNIVDENDTPLGIAEVNKDEGTYTFIDNNRVPQGVAKIRKDNSLEVLEVFENDTPQGKLPITGGVNEGILIFLGSILLCISALLKKRLG